MFIGSALAGDVPAQSAGAMVGPAGPGQPPPLYYGYVAPPPIRHTWPGGYKVIFHDLVNTLMEHIIGQY